jgi:hypothetical protein
MIYISTMKSVFRIGGICRAYALVVAGVALSTSFTVLSLLIAHSGHNLNSCQGAKSALILVKMFGYIIYEQTSGTSSTKIMGLLNKKFIRIQSTWYRKREACRHPFYDTGRMVLSMPFSSRLSIA